MTMQAATDSVNEMSAEYPDTLQVALVDGRLRFTFKDRFIIIHEATNQELAFDHETEQLLDEDAMEALLVRLQEWHNNLLARRQQEEQLAAELKVPDTSKLREAIRSKMQEHIQKANELSNQLLNLS